jgi:SMC interacting uncharacterized protein involved in chromosome segregation
MEPEAEHAFLRERLARLIFRVDARISTTGETRDVRQRLEQRREEARDLNAALSRAKNEIRRLKDSLAYPSPVQMAEDSVRTRRRKLREVCAECEQWQLLLASGREEAMVLPPVAASKRIWTERLSLLRKEHEVLKQRLRQVDDILRDKHGNLVVHSRKVRDAETGEIDKLERQIRMFKASQDCTPL